jgi:hypothetical protein
MGLEPPSTLPELLEFAAYVIQNGERRVGTWMRGRPDQILGARWYRLGDAVVVTRPNGEYITNLDGAGGGAMRDWPEVSE